jgi:RNAse (barnase) inhibitor barstar
MVRKPVIEIDGLRFDGLDGFWNEVSAKLIPGIQWGRNLDAFNDILSGGFGTPDGGFVLRWRNFQKSSKTLGYPETLRWLNKKVEHCHPASVGHVRNEIEAAQRGQGPTLLDIILEIIRIHGPGGPQEEDGVELELA